MTFSAQRENFSQWEVHGTGNQGRHHSKFVTVNESPSAIQPHLCCRTKLLAAINRTGKAGGGFGVAATTSHEQSQNMVILFSSTYMVIMGLWRTSDTSVLHSVL